MGAGLGAQEQNQASEVARLANTTCGLSGSECLPVLLESKVCHAARKDARTDDVDHDVLGREFRSSHLGEVDGCCLRRSICTVVISMSGSSLGGSKLTAEGTMSWLGQPTCLPRCNIQGLDTCHTRNVDDSSGTVWVCTLEEQRL